MFHIAHRRLYLGPYDLTPTHQTVHNKYSVKYYLNLVLVDEEDRRYFKQHEITLFRRQDGDDAGHSGSSIAPALTSVAVPQLAPAAESGEALPTSSMIQAAGNTSNGSD